MAEWGIDGNPRLFNKTGVIGRSKATLLVSSLGCFERINLGF
jgi:hypothetical protein